MLLFAGLIGNRYSCADCYMLKYILNMGIVHANTSTGYLLPNQIRPVGAVNSVARFAEPQPVCAEYTTVRQYFFILD